MAYNGYYSKTAIEEARKKLPERVTKGDDAEPYEDYLARMTVWFKSSFQYQRPDDLAYFRARVGNHRNLLQPFPTTRTLSPTFNDHVRGNEAGKGWHTEAVHKKDDRGYNYETKVDIATSKGTYYVTEVEIMSVKKKGNDGVCTFFPRTLPIDTIRHDAEYVANTSNPTVGNNQVITGRGQKTGIFMDCLMNGDIVVSAYPHKDE